MVMPQASSALFSGGLQIPQPQLLQLLSALQPQQPSQSAAINMPNEANPPALPQQSSKSGGGSPLIQSALSSLGGLMGGSGTGPNSFNQGLAFAAAPSGAVGPFAASSPLSAIGSGTGVAAGGVSPLAMLASFFM